MKRLKITLSAFLICLSVSQSVTFVAASDTDFSDVSTEAWYADAIKYCSERDLMGGIGNGEFFPNIPMSRAMLVTVLYHMEGDPNVSGSSGFADVLMETWYANAITWATQKETVKGYENGLFGINDPVTREQIVSILWRYSGSPASANTTIPFSDAANISSYAISAVNWARGMGVIDGKPGNLFDPKGNVTRAEVAAIMQNYLNAAQSEPIPAPTPTTSSSSTSSSSASTPKSTPTPTPKPSVKPDYFNTGSLISDVINDSAFGDYGRLIYPANTGYYSGNTLGELSLTWYSNIVPAKTVEIVNYMKTHAEAGDVIFYDIYTDSEKAADPAKKDTGLFFFKGNPGGKFAVCNAGGGFVYVGAMHDSFPHALSLSKNGYNAFALIYRPGAQTACEDLARALSFIFEHADELEVDTDCYSLWGGSAGARMVANLGSYGSAAFGGNDLPRPGTVIMQYTGHSDYTRNDPPTYVCVGENDGIASWRTMEQRVNNLKAAGIDTEFHKYPNLGHGFGLGIGTSAEGWFDDAVKFWEKQMNQ